MNYKFTGHYWPLRIARVTILNESFVLPCNVNSFLENGNRWRIDGFSRKVVPMFDTTFLEKIRFKLTWLTSARADLDIKIDVWRKF